MCDLHSLRQTILSRNRCKVYDSTTRTLSSSLTQRVDSVKSLRIYTSTHCRLSGLARGIPFFTGASQHMGLARAKARLQWQGGGCHNNSTGTGDSGLTKQHIPILRSPIQWPLVSTKCWNTYALDAQACPIRSLFAPVEAEEAARFCTERF